MRTMCNGVRVVRCEIWEAKLHKTEGSVQYGQRPVIIVQCRLGNEKSPNVTVIPLTKALKTKIATHVNIPMSRTNGLTKDSTALVEGITTISKSQLVNRRGRVSESIMREIEKKIMIQLGIEVDRYVS